MKITQQGIDLIHSFEGCRLEAYKCLPSEQFFTIGWGHYGPDVRIGMKITREEADALFLKDVVKYENAVNKYDHIYHWNQNQFDALTSFAYNIGSIDQLTNNGKRTIYEISSKIPDYNKSGGSVIPGLVRRRSLERELFDKPCIAIESYRKDNISIKDVTIKLPYSVLKLGSKGEGVKALQFALNVLYDNDLIIDGIFGSKTEASIIGVQIENNLDQDGIYGKETRKAMNNRLKEVR